MPSGAGGIAATMARSSAISLLMAASQAPNGLLSDELVALHSTPSTSSSTAVPRPGAAHVEHDPSLDEEHWSYMDGFAAA